MANPKVIIMINNEDQRMELLKHYNDPQKVVSFRARLSEK